MRSKVLPLTLSLCACTAKMVAPPGSTTPDPNAPINEVGRPGVVSYLNEGISSVRQARRRNAYKKMHDACAGPYRIDREGDQVDGGVVVGGAHVAVLTRSHRWYIQFSCVRAGATPDTTLQHNDSTTQHHPAALSNKRLKLPGPAFKGCVRLCANVVVP